MSRVHRFPFECIGDVFNSVLCSFVAFSRRVRADHAAHPRVRFAFFCPPGVDRMRRPASQTVERRERVSCPRARVRSEEVVRELSPCARDQVVTWQTLRTSWVIARLLFLQLYYYILFIIFFIEKRKFIKNIFIKKKKILKFFFL